MRSPYGTFSTGYDAFQCRVRYFQYRVRCFQHIIRCFQYKVHHFQYTVCRCHCSVWETTLFESARGFSYYHVGPINASSSIPRTAEDNRHADGTTRSKGGKTQADCQGESPNPIGRCRN